MYIKFKGLLVNKSILSSLFYVSLLLSFYSESFEEIQTIEANGMETGASLSAGIFSVNHPTCNTCDYTGQFLAAGYDYNEYIELEIKYFKGEGGRLDNLYYKSVYGGVNLGYDFDTDWFKFYGKVGFEDSKQKFGFSCPGFGSCVDTVYKESSVRLGLGAKFELSSFLPGLLLQMEAHKTEVSFGESTNLLNLGIGYRF